MNLSPHLQTIEVKQASFYRKDLLSRVINRQRAEMEAEAEEAYHEYEQGDFRRDAL